MPSPSTDSLLMGEALEQQLNEWRGAGKRIIFTNGCFDLLHVGHVSLLNRAKELGDVLLLGINSDQSVKRLKGEGRPVNTVQDRAYVLSALGCVDAVTAFSEDTPEALLDLVKPAVHVKGGDYVAEELPEYDIVSANGGEVLILPFIDGYSTTGYLS